MSGALQKPGSAEKLPDPITRLRVIVATLRGPGGCPWDIEQDHRSLRSALIEECFEVLEAIEASDDKNLREELGDLLLHVAMHSQMAEERGAFDLDDVAGEICEKLIRRHPHVFGNEDAATTGAVLMRWEEIKLGEKHSKDPAAKTHQSAFDGIPRGLPSLAKALKAQKKAAKLGLDWPSADGVMAKLSEELNELRLAAESGNSGRIAAEIGDILFTAVNLARVFKTDPEHALRDTTARFIARAKTVEQLAREEGCAAERLDGDELDNLWERSKRREAGNSTRGNADP